MPDKNCFSYLILLNARVNEPFLRAFLSCKNVHLMRHFCAFFSCKNARLNEPFIRAFLSSYVVIKRTFKCAFPSIQNLRITKTYLLDPAKKSIYDIKKVEDFRPVTPIAVIRPKAVYHSPNVFPAHYVYSAPIYSVPVTCGSMYRTPYYRTPLASMQRRPSCGTRVSFAQ